MCTRLSWFLPVLLAMGIVLTGLSATAQGVRTQVMVRAISRDAKVIQDPVGGARITIRDVASGAVLAEGLQKGRSGSTELIMIKPRERGAKIYDTPGTAGFLATLDLERPTVVDITAEGPLAYPQAIQKASKTLLLVPGQHILGEGVLLEIHGFIVELLAPAPDALLGEGDVIEVRARVRMA